MHLLSFYHIYGAYSLQYSHNIQPHSAASNINFGQAVCAPWYCPCMAGEQEDNHLGLREHQEESDRHPNPNPAKRLCLENFSSFTWGEETDNAISMDNSSEVVTKIAGLYAERLMSDVLLVVGKQELPAHRLILCASSDVFQIMLMSRLVVVRFVLQV